MHAGQQIHLVKPAVVVHRLAHELDGALRVVLVHEGHVHVVHKVDQLLGTWRPVAGACTALLNELSEQEPTAQLPAAIVLHWL